MRFSVVVGLLALAVAARASENLHESFLSEMKKHEDEVKNKTISELAHEVVREARSIGSAVSGYVKSAIAAAGSTKSRQARDMKDLVSFFTPTDADFEESARTKDSSFLGGLFKKLADANLREQRAEGDNNETTTTTTTAAPSTSSEATKESNDAALKAGASYNAPAPAPYVPPQQMNYNYQQPPNNNYQQPPNNNYQSYSTPPAYAAPSYTTPYTYTTPYIYTTPYTYTTTTTTKKPPPILVPIPGPPGPPGPPGLMGLPGLPGKTPSLAGLKVILLAKLAKLTLLIQAIAVLCLVKFGGLLALFFGLIFPLVGKLKSAGVVLPVEEPEDPGYGPAPSNSYGAPSSSYGAPSTGYGAPSTGYDAPPAAAPTGYDRAGTSGSFAPLSQSAVDDLTGSVLPSIEANSNKYAGRPLTKPAKRPAKKRPVKN